MKKLLLAAVLFGAFSFAVASTNNQVQASEEVVHEFKDTSFAHREYWICSRCGHHNNGATYKCVCGMRRGI